MKQRGARGRVAAGGLVQQATGEGARTSAGQGRCPARTSAEYRRKSVGPKAIANTSTPRRESVMWVRPGARRQSATEIETARRDRSRIRARHAQALAGSRRISRRSSSARFRSNAYARRYRAALSTRSRGRGGRAAERPAAASQAARRFFTERRAAAFCFACATIHPMAATAMPRITLGRMPARD